MGTKSIAVFGATVGLLVAGAILVLLWLGVSGILKAGQTDVMYVLWPSSLILVAGWRTTSVGILIALLAVLVNCALYACLATLLRSGIGLVARVLSRFSTTA